MPESFYAKRPGICAACQDYFNTNDRIVYYSQVEIYHYRCRPIYTEAYDPAKHTQQGFLFLDTETGGLDEKTCALTQIAVIATTCNFLILGSYQSKINPPENLLITEKATEITRHTRESLSTERPESIVLDEFVEWCLHYPEFRFSGYNCLFDVRFLREAYRRHDIEERPYWFPPLDLYPVAKKKLKNITVNHKLGTVAEHYGFSPDGAHDALTDDFLAIQVARCLMAA